MPIGSFIQKEVFQKDKLSQTIILLEAELNKYFMLDLGHFFSCFNYTMFSKNIIQNKLCDCGEIKDTQHFLIHFAKAKKRKCLVSGYPTDPNILGPTQTF